MRDIAVALADDCGGAAVLTEAEKLLVRQAASNALVIERLQAEVLAGRSVDHGELARLTSANSELLERLRPKRRAP